MRSCEAVPVDEHYKYNSVCWDPKRNRFHMFHKGLGGMDCFIKVIGTNHSQKTQKKKNRLEHGWVSHHFSKWVCEYVWLVVDSPSWKIWKSMGRIIPYIMEKNVWNHQSDVCKLGTPKPHDHDISDTTNIMMLNDAPRCHGKLPVIIL